jgi:1-acyl-sn-glycerol-3-phosphate acyltransferase
MRALGWPLLAIAITLAQMALLYATLRLATRLAHTVRQANRVNWGRRWLNVLDGLNRMFCRRYHRLRFKRLNLPAEGPAIVVSNHPSGLDPLLLIAASRRPLRFLIAREEYDRFGFNWLFRAVGCIPIDRERSPRAALAAARSALRAGEVIALFPHGRLHGDHEPPRLRRGVMHLATTTGAPIIPVRVEGVRGQGQVLLAVLRRSHARVYPLARFHPQEGEEEQVALDRLARLLAGHGRRGRE